MADATLTVASYNAFYHILSTNVGGTTMQPAYDGSGAVAYDGTRQYVFDAEVESVLRSGQLSAALQLPYLYDAEG